LDVSVLEHLEEFGGQRSAFGVGSGVAWIGGDEAVGVVFFFFFFWRFGGEMEWRGVF
jgi:hypothetical protein